MNRNCFVCGGKLNPARISGLLKCEQCSFTTADVTLSDQDLQQLYSDSYFTGNEYRDYVADRPVIEKQGRTRLRKILRFMPEPKDKNLFEIGCAHGFFLALAKDMFRSAQGVDISAEAVAYASKVSAVSATSSDFLTYQFVERPDLVCMWDTIEHVRRPDLYIKKIAGALDQGGLLALTTSDIDSWVARFRGRKWRQIHPPTHLHYFSRKTLHRLLSQNGLKIKQLSSEGIYRRVETMAYIILCLRYNAHRFYSILRNLGVLNWDLYLNLGDVLFVIAQKT